MDDYKEYLFQKIIKNKYLFNYILSLTNIKYYTIKYESFKDVSNIIQSKNLMLLVDKVKNKQPLVFPIPQYDEYTNERDENDDIFIDIFRAIKDPSLENLEFYKYLFTNYKDYVIDFNVKLRIIVQNDCLAAFLVLLNSTFSITKPPSLSINFQELFDLSLSYYSIEIINYLIINHYNELNVSASYLWSKILNEGTNRESKLKIIIKLLEISPNLILNDQIPKTKLIKSLFSNSTSHLSLLEVILACKVIILFQTVIPLDTNYSSDSILSNIKQIESKYTFKQLNRRFYSYPRNDILSLNQIYDSFSNREKDIEYYLKFEEEFKDFENLKQPVIHSSMILCLNYASINYLNYLHGTKIHSDSLSFGQIFNRLNDSDDIKKKQFISKLVELNTLSTFFVLCYLLEYNNIELVDHFTKLFNGNEENYYMNKFNQTTSSLYNIKNYIKSKEMLFYCFNNQVLKSILLDERYLSKVFCWCKKNRFDLLEYYNQLLQENQIINKDQLILPPLFQNNFVEISNDSNENIIFTVEYIIKKEKETQRLYDPNKTLPLKYYDEQTAIGLTFVKIHYFNKDFSKILNTVKYIIENTSYQYSPFQIIPFLEDDSYSKFCSSRVLWIKFMDWIFSFRQNDIKSGRCILLEYREGNRIQKTIDYYYLSLYLTGRIDQLFNQVKLIELRSHFLLLVDEIGKKGDIDAFDKLLEFFENLKPNYSKSPISLFNHKADIIKSLLESASLYGSINLFNHIYLNHYNNNILKFKNNLSNNNNNNNLLITEHYSYNIIKNAIDEDNLVLFNFFYNYLDYNEIHLFSSRLKKDTIIYNYYRNLISKY